MTSIYIEAFSGLTSATLLVAFAELADAYDDIIKLPNSLNILDIKVEFTDIHENGIECKCIKVINTDEKKGNQIKLLTKLSNLNDIYRIIKNALITNKAKQIAKKIYLIIAEAESRIQNTDIEHIYFSESSDLDSIISIIGCAILIDKLSINKTYSTAICTGFGFVNKENGKLPIPVPTTDDLLTSIPTYAGIAEGELTTQAGAAILKYLNPEFNPPILVKDKVAYGSGQNNYSIPNLVRVSTVKEEQNKSKLYILETNIDDFSNEFLGKEFQDELLLNGALDFYFNHIQMKKARPGILLSCSVLENNIDKLSDYILENTSTIGIRYYPVQKKMLKK